MTYQEALKYSMDFCSRQEKCISEVSQKLSSMRISSAEIERVIDTLVRENFINEPRYAEFYCRDKLRFNKWGKVKTRYFLAQKGLPVSVIEEAINGIDEEYYKGILREEMLKKRKTIKGSNVFDVRGKLFRFAQQRGFETGLIYQVIDEIL